MKVLDRPGSRYRTRPCCSQKSLLRNSGVGGGPRWGSICEPESRDMEVSLTVPLPLPPALSQHPDFPPILRKDYHQSFAQPDFGADLKKGLSGDFLLVFLCFRPKGPQKNLRETLVTSDTRVSLVKVLPKIPSCLGVPQMGI